jgi:hypothetical protein
VRVLLFVKIKWKSRQAWWRQASDFDDLDSGSNINGFCRSNLKLVLDKLTNLGYQVTTEKLRSDEFGLPQRRCRLYFFGVRQVDRMSECSDVLNNIRPLLNAMKQPLELTPAPCRRLMVSTQTLGLQTLDFRLRL